MTKRHLSDQCDAAFYVDDEAMRFIASSNRNSIGSTISKSDAAAAVHPSGPKRAQDTRTNSIIRRWNLLRPHLGVAALVIASCCVIFSLAILVSSNGKPVESWSVRPSVYLAIASAIANSAVAFAYTQAVVIAWWYKASKGATIRTLARQWEAGSSVFHALLKVGDMTIVVAGAILVTLIVADGPLLQSASRVNIATQSRPVNLAFSLAPEVPTGFSGIERPYTISATNGVLQVFEDWLHQTPFSISFSPPCDGTCVAKIKGPGVAKTNCSSSIWPITYEMMHSRNATWGPWSGKIPEFLGIQNPIFISLLQTHSLFPGSWSLLSEAGILEIGMVETFNQSGQYTQTWCALVPAVREYMVAFNNSGNVQILADPNAEDKVLSFANNTMAVNSTSQRLVWPRTLDMLTWLLGSVVGANASAEFVPAPHSGPNKTWNWVPLVNTFNDMATKQYNLSGLSATEVDIHFRNPIPYIVDSYNELMFRAGVMTATWPNLTSLIDPGLSPHQSTLANQTTTQPVFQSNFGWYAGATVLELTVILAVLVMYRSYWKLDRDLDFSPFRIGLAFDAPLLRAADAAIGAADVVERLGHVSIRYGKVTGSEKDSSSPRDEQNGEPANYARLGFGQSCDVRPL